MVQDTIANTISKILKGQTFGMNFYYNIEITRNILFVHDVRNANNEKIREIVLYTLPVAQLINGDINDTTNGDNGWSDECYDENDINCMVSSVISILGMCGYSDGMGAGYVNDIDPNNDEMENVKIYFLKDNNIAH